MQQETGAFRIYDASAGSGKTFTLAGEYLRLLLKSDARQAYRKILAITFTNKAVGELKARILSSLVEFSRTGDSHPPSAMFRAVMEALGTDSATLAGRSRRVLQELLHNYAFFDISTIDKFNHRILRTFAQDLHLPANFEVVLDTDALLMRAVDTLVARAGSEPALTEVLIEFALEKAEEDRHWDVSSDLFDMGRLLFDENHFAHLEHYSGKEFGDFIRLRDVLASKRKQSEKVLLGLANEALSLIRASGLEATDFTRAAFPKFLEKIAGGEFEQDFDALWKQNFGQEPPYPKKTAADKQKAMDELLPRFTSFFGQIQQETNHWNFLANAYRNIAPFTVLGLLQQELNTLRDEEGLLPISFFNAIIARELADQPAPYIYERLGERYRHYFIDEFQDTSRLQWNNLVPLISNALLGVDEQGEQGSLVLVGDAKQAIYRWRGGKAEQFLSLIDGSDNPFSLEARLESLPKNYRSHRQVVEFNNDFFGHVSRYLSRTSYSQLFLKGSEQVYDQEQPGLVSLDFIPGDSEDQGEAYALKTLEIIRSLKDQGVSYGDICILTRRRQEGVFLSGHLMRAGIPVISSETLLLQNHPGIQFLIHLLNYLQAPEDRNHAFGILLHLSAGLQDRHDWIVRHLAHLDGLLRESFGFDPVMARLKPVYQVLEEAIREFDLGGKADAYLISLMDLALEVGRSRQSSVQAFLEYWDTRKEELSIVAPEGFDAVALMTIHKSKGLEFPVVVYPFANSPIYWEKNPRLWLPVDPDSFAGFQSLLVTKKKALADYEEPAPEYYRQEREKLELDAFNLLYVVHTRAIRALYVISKDRGNSGQQGNPQRYGDLYTLYLREKGLWEEGCRTYSFGKLVADQGPTELEPKDHVSFRYTARDRTSLRVVTRSGRLWDSEREKALEYGNILHYALSLIESAPDIDPSLDRLLSEGLISRGERKDLREILSRLVEHPALASCFQPGLQVFNEREILTENGLILRPDRLVLNKGRVSVIDYKTGAPGPGHREQVLAYCGAIESTGRAIDSAMIIYMDGKHITPEIIYP